MCGRVTQRISSSELARIFHADDLVESDVERFNVAPTDPIAIVVERTDRRTVEAARWGLVPSWAEDLRGAAKMINARAETLESSSAFRRSFERGRCVVPVAGFYEWKRMPDGRRQPFYITTPDGSPMPFAGLRATWRPASGGAPPVRTCAIVTTRPNELMARLHNRMPAILPADAVGAWLDPEFASRDLLRVALEPFTGELVAYPVSPLVNRVGNDGPALVEPIPSETAPELWTAAGT